MCQCHKMWQSEGAMQVQVAHSKQIPPGEKKFLHGVPAFFSGGTPGGGGGYEKKIRANFFSTTPLRTPEPWRYRVWAAYQCTQRATTDEAPLKVEKPKICNTVHGTQKPCLVKQRLPACPPPQESCTLIFRTLSLGVYNVPKLPTIVRLRLLELQTAGPLCTGKCCCCPVLWEGGLRPPS